MWRQIVEFGRNLFSLTQRVTSLETADAEIRGELKELNAKVAMIEDAIRRLVFELQRDRDQAAAERRQSEADRKMLLLEIENRFLRHERGLPPAEPRE